MSAHAPWRGEDARALRLALALTIPWLSLGGFEKPPPQLCWGPTPKPLVEKGALSLRLAKGRAHREGDQRVSWATVSFEKEIHILRAIALTRPCLSGDNCTIVITQGAEQTVERLGKFELLDQIGHGGMATVHRALLRGMGGFERQVVIKRILPELASDDHFVKMFIAEAKLSAQLDHPNIVQIYDFGVVDKTYYLAMEFLEGVTLLNFIKKHGKGDPVPPSGAAYVIHQVCLGLHYAHCLERDGRPLGLVHRDVSPANVMLTAHGGVKVLDFGIAKAVEAIEREDTRTGTLKGKWSYMAPEQVEGKDVTPRSDIFSAGIMFWEMLTARRLFKAKTDYLTLSNVVRAKVPPISTFRPDVPEIFDRVCAKALARDPDDRYQTADEMADALEEILMTSRFTASQLSTMVGSQISTWETVAPAEPSISNSDSLSDSAVGFVAGSGEASVSSLVKG